MVNTSPGISRVSRVSDVLRQRLAVDFFALSGISLFHRDQMKQHTA